MQAPAKFTTHIVLAALGLIVYHQAQAARIEPATLMVQSALISAPLEKLMGPWAVKALPAGSMRAAWAW